MTIFIIAFSWIVIITTRQRSWGKVMFSLMSVCLYVNRGSPCHHYTWCIGTHCTDSPLALAPPRHQTWGLPYASPSYPGSDNWWPSLETCSNLFTWGPPNSTDIWWLPKHICIASGRYASYWNAFLLNTCNKQNFGNANRKCNKFDQSWINKDVLAVLSCVHR